MSCDVPLCAPPPVLRYKSVSSTWFLSSPLDETAKSIANTLSENAGPDTTGSVTVRTVSWSSKGDNIKRQEKTKTWGGSESLQDVDFSLEPPRPQDDMASLKPIGSYTNTLIINTQHLHADWYSTCTFQFISRIFQFWHSMNEWNFQ